jgi:hypothetical protein
MISCLATGDGWPEAGVINIPSTGRNNSDKKIKRVLQHSDFFKITSTSNVDVIGFGRKSIHHSEHVGNGS